MAADLSNFKLVAWRRVNRRRRRMAQSRAEDQRRRNDQKMQSCILLQILSRRHRIPTAFILAFTAEGQQFVVGGWAVLGVGGGGISSYWSHKETIPGQLMPWGRAEHGHGA